MSVYTDLKEAGIPLDSHESDLYVLSTSEAWVIIRKHKKRGESFKSQIDGKIWIDLPFCYDPFWENVHRKSLARKGMS